MASSGQQSENLTSPPYDSALYIQWVCDSTSVLSDSPPPNKWAAIEIFADTANKKSPSTKPVHSSPNLPVPTPVPILTISRARLYGNIRPVPGVSQRHCTKNTHIPSCEAVVSASTGPWTIMSGLVLLCCSRWAARLGEFISVKQVFARVTTGQPRRAYAGTGLPQCAYLNARSVLAAGCATASEGSCWLACLRTASDGATVVHSIVRPLVVLRFAQQYPAVGRASEYIVTVGR